MASLADVTLRRVICPRRTVRRPVCMLHAGLDLSRKRLDYCLLAQSGEHVDVGAVAADGDGLVGLARVVELRHGQPVRAAIESMNGARFVHDVLERCGWQVAVADAQKVKGLAPLACKTDRIDARVLAELSRRDLVPAIWLPDPQVRAERERARFRLHLVRQRSRLKQRARPCSRTGSPAPSPTCLASPAAGCWSGCDCPSPGRGRCRPAWS